MPKTDNRGRYDRKPSQVVKMKATFIRNRIEKLEAKLAEDKALLADHEAEVARLVAEEAA